VTDWQRLSSASSKTEHTCRFPGERGCRGCRWFETHLSRRPSSIWSDAPDWEYRLEIAGRSSVPGETDRLRVETTSSAHAVVDFLALGQPDNRYIPKVSRMVLHEAADIDAAIGDAIDDFDMIVRP
jgi:hypothetical protein